MLAGCTSSHRESPTSSSTLPTSPLQPLPPIADADPSRRHAASIRVPTGVRAVRESEELRSTTELVQWHLAFTGYETASLTVGHKMVTGVRVETTLRDGGRCISGTYGKPSLPSEIPAPDLGGFRTNKIPSECRITIFETDQPAGYHVEPEDGKYYKVLWTRAFVVTIE